VGDEDVLGEQRPLGDDEVQTSVFDSVEERTDLRAGSAPATEVTGHCGPASHLRPGVHRGMVKQSPGRGGTYPPVPWALTGDLACRGG